MKISTKTTILPKWLKVMVLQLLLTFMYGQQEVVSLVSHVDFKDLSSIKNIANIEDKLINRNLTSFCNASNCDLCYALGNCKWTNSGCNNDKVGQQKIPCQPQIHSLIPQNVSIHGGTELIIKGSNFGGSELKINQDIFIEVKLGGIPCPVIEHSNTELLVRTPNFKKLKFPYKEAQLMVKIRTVGNNPLIHYPIEGKVLAPELVYLYQFTFKGIYPDHGIIASGVLVLVAGDFLDVGVSGVLKFMHKGRVESLCYITQKCPNYWLCETSNFHSGSKKEMETNALIEVDYALTLPEKNTTINHFINRSELNSKCVTGFLKLYPNKTVLELSPKFTFKPNPYIKFQNFTVLNITDWQILQVRGTGFEALQNQPKYKLIYNREFVHVSANCWILNSTSFECMLPDMSRWKEKILSIHFFFDGYENAHWIDFVNPPTFNFLFHQVQDKNMTVWIEDIQPYLPKLPFKVLFNQTETCEVTEKGENWIVCHVNMAEMNIALETPFFIDLVMAGNTFRVGANNFTREYIKTISPSEMANLIVVHYQLVLTIFNVTLVVAISILFTYYMRQNELGNRNEIELAPI